MSPKRLTREVARRRRVAIGSRAAVWGIVWAAVGLGACARAAVSPPPARPVEAATSSRTRQVGAAGAAGTLTARPLGSTPAPSGYYEFLPAGYGHGAKPPLLIFLHGVGENGDGVEQLPRVLKHGPLQLVSAHLWPVERPFVVLSPQHRPTVAAPSPAQPVVGRPRRDCPTADEIHDFLTYALDHYDIDRRRVYLTGLSCGAIGAWEYLARFSGEQVAAAVLIAGDGRSAWAARRCELANALPIWGFHGAADAVVPAEGTSQPMQSLMACPRPPRQEQRLTVYPGVGHNAWAQTYAVADPANDIYAWLLGFAR